MNAISHMKLKPLKQDHAIWKKSYATRISKKWLWLLITLGLCIETTKAETLEVKVMEIEGRLIEATLTAAFAADRDAFEVVIGKLSALGPERGVHHLADLKLEGKRGMLNASMNEWKRHKSLPGRRRAFSVGPELNWMMNIDDREMNVQMAPTLEMAPLYRFEPVHPADGKWSLSGAVRGLRGMVMMFERVVGRPVENDASGRAWLVANLSNTQPGKIDAKEPWRSVVETKGPAAAILRIQTAADGGRAGKAVADFQRYSSAWEEYTDGEFKFAMGTAVGKLAGTRFLLYDFDFPQEQSVAKVIKWRGEGHVKIDANTQMFDQVLKAEVWHDIGEKSCDPSKLDAKKAPPCFIQGMIFHTR